MVSGKSKLQRVRKISGWMMFICMLIWLFTVSALIQLEEESTIAAICLAVFLLSVILAVLNVLGSFVLQIVLNSQKEGTKEAFWKLLKEFVLCVGVAALIILVSAIREKMEMHVEMLWDILGMAVAVVISIETVKFWK